MGNVRELSYLQKQRRYIKTRAKKSLYELFSDMS